MRYPEIYEYVRVRGNLSIAEDNIKKALQLSNIQLSATMTANLLNITRATEIAKYYYSMGVDYHTSIVQFSLVH